MEARATYNLVLKLYQIGACPSSVRWLRAGKFTSALQAWRACEEPEWMLWLLRHTRRYGVLQRELEGAAITYKLSAVRGERGFRRLDMCEAIRLIVPRPPRRFVPGDEDHLPF